MDKSISHAQGDEYLFTLIEVEKPKRTFDPLSVLPAVLNKELFLLWGRTRHGNFCSAALTVLAKYPEALKKLEDEGLLPAYFCYSLEYVFNQGRKP